MRQFLTWLLLEKASPGRALMFGGLFAATEFLLLAIAGLADGSLFLPGRSLGLLEHPGIAAVILSDFAVVGLLGFAVCRFQHLARRIPVEDRPANRRLLRAAVTRGVRILLLRGPALRWFWFCLGVGSLFWLQNAIQTQHALEVYGHDVFDSSEHPASYLAFRLVLWISWAIVYPYIVIAFLGMSGNIHRATRVLGLRRQLAHQMFHPDGSGGYATIGDINFAAIMATLVLYAALGVVVLTHQKLNPLQISGFIILSTALVWLTYWISWPTTQYLERCRRQGKVAAYRRLKGRRDQFVVARLLWAADGTPYSPYSRYQKALIAGARLAPAVIAGLRVLTAS